MTAREGIDFVITWVNDADAEWQARRRAAAERLGRATSDSSDVRYRDWGLLKYWFRSVELFCPWVRTVHLVTDTALPDWLDVRARGLNVVDGRRLKGDDVDTYSSRSIESRLHLIPGLSERFVYFNDDFFLGRPAGPDFYFRDGRPYGLNVPTILADGDMRAHAMLIASGMINKHFTRASYLRTMLSRTFRPSSGAALGRLPLFLGCSRIPPTSDPHVAMPLLKSVIAEAYAAEPEEIERARRAVFRSRSEVAPLYYAQMWHLATGRYFALSKRSIGRYFSLADSSIDDITDAIVHDRLPQYCLNDGAVEDADAVMAALIGAYDRRFPERSRFER